MSEGTETMLLPRADDAAGEGFAVKLAAMKRQVAKRTAAPVAKPDFEWFVDDVEPEADEEWMITASPPGLFLEVVKMQEGFLATQPPEAPRICWCVYRGTHERRTFMMGGRAPTWQVAQARAEAIWRVAANIRPDA
jgi:hypothetical protein